LALTENTSLITARLVDKSLRAFYNRP
jgi:hypothetical protein